ncbi:helix-turn-helix domain-containing protein [Nocardia sp. NPDC051570]|uniref:helix-turn-helix domain-containing protein n=1 Tax=Nocardia sp. NPDC051570 TaxID=3364324 RepID=UPI0037B46686
MAALLRKLREDAGVSAEEAYRTISVSKHTLWRMETGQMTKYAPHTVKALCELYRATADDTQVAMVLAEESKVKSWWLAFDDTMPAGFAYFIGLEEAADRIWTYQNTLLPGLVQTADYRRALAWVEVPNMPTEEVERRVELSMKRQERLTNSRNPLKLSILLDEAILHRPIGGRRVMSEQLRHLAEVGSLPNVSIRVVPISAEAYLGLASQLFVVFDFPLHPTARLTVPPVIFVQGFLGDVYLESETEVRLYREAYAAIERVALDEDASCALILRVAEELSE